MRHSINPARVPDHLSRRPQTGRGWHTVPSEGGEATSTAQNLSGGLYEELEETESAEDVIGGWRLSTCSAPGGFRPHAH